MIRYLKISFLGLLLFCTTLSGRAKPRSHSRAVMDTAVSSSLLFATGIMTYKLHKAYTQSRAAHDYMHQVRYNGVPFNEQKYQKLLIQKLPEGQERFYKYSTWLGAWLMVVFGLEVGHNVWALWQAALVSKGVENQQLGIFDPHCSVSVTPDDISAALRLCTRLSRAQRDANYSTNPIDTASKYGLFKLYDSSSLQEATQVAVDQMRKDVTNSSWAQCMHLFGLRLLGHLPTNIAWYQRLPHCGSALATIAADS